MKILQLIDVYKHGGAEKVFDAYNSFCQNEKIELDRYTIYKSDNASLNYLIDSNSASIIEKVFQQLAGSRKLSRIIADNNYDRIISFLDRSNIMSILAAKGETRVVATVHNPPTIQYEKLGLLKEFVFVLLRHFYNKKNITVIAVSKQVQESLKSIGVKNVKIVYNPLLPNETEESYFVFPKPYFIAVGRVSYQKAHWKLIKAVSILKSKYNKQAYLVIVGDGDLLEKLKKLSCELGVSELVHFTGFVNNPFSIIKNAYCMIFSSYFEGFPITVLESFYCKTPVIGTRVALPEEIRIKISASEFYYENKKQFENFDSTVFDDDDFKIADIMLRALEDDNSLRLIAESGRVWVTENCSLNNFEMYM